MGPNLEDGRRQRAQLCPLDLTKNEEKELGLACNFESRFFAQSFRGPSEANGPLGRAWEEVLRYDSKEQEQIHMLFMGPHTCPFGID